MDIMYMIFFANNLLDSICIDCFVRAPCMACTFRMNSCYVHGVAAVFVQYLYCSFSYAMYFSFVTDINWLNFDFQLSV